MECYNTDLTNYSYGQLSVFMCFCAYASLQSVLGSLMSFFKSAEAVPEMDTFWISESGIVDAFILLGPRPHDIFQQYSVLTGTTQLPPVRFEFCILLESY